MSERDPIEAKVRVIADRLCTECAKLSPKILTEMRDLLAILCLELLLPEESRKKYPSAVMSGIGCLAAMKGGYDEIARSVADPVKYVCDVVTEGTERVEAAALASLKSGGQGQSGGGLN